MNSRRAMDKYFCFWIFKRSQSKFNAPPEELCRFRFEVVLGWIPQYADTVWFSQLAIVELDLHVDDVGNTAADHRDHVEFVPDTPADRQPVGHPSQVHACFALPSPFPAPR